MSSLESISVVVRAKPSILYSSFNNNEELRKWFPDLCLVENEEQIKKMKFLPHEIDYFLVIKNRIPNQKITGYLIPAWDINLDRLGVEYILESTISTKLWTRCVIKFNEPNLQKEKNGGQSLQVLQLH